MMTRSAGRATTAPRGGRMGERTGRGSGRTRGGNCDLGNGGIDEQGGQVFSQGNEVNDGVDGVANFFAIIAHRLQNLLPTILAQVGNQGNNQGNNRNQNDDAVNNNIQGDVSNVIVNNDRRGCSYKEFLACNPKYYNGKGGATVYTRWIKKMETVQDMSGCGDDQKAKYTAGSFINPRDGGSNGANDNSEGCAESWYTNDEAIRNGSLKNNPEKKGNGGKPSRDRNVKDDNKRTRTRNAFAIAANPVRREYTGAAPKVVPRMVNPVNARDLTAVHRACFECGGTDHFKAACPRLNQAQRPGRNHLNQVVANNGGQGHGNNDNQARGRAFMLGSEEAH
nr:reverse transcriptase domain-containing protein [Tanacetum cinerariifolium]